MTIQNELRAIFAGASRELSRTPVQAGIKISALVLFLVLSNAGLWQFIGALPEQPHPAVAGAFVFVTWLGFAAICAVIAFDPDIKARLAWGGVLAFSTFLFLAAEAVVGAPISFNDAQMYWSMRADADAAIKSFWLAMLPALATGGLGLAAFALPPAGLTWPWPVDWRLLRVTPAVPALVLGLAIPWDGGKVTLAYPVQYKLASFLPVITLRNMLDVWPEREAVALPLAGDIENPPHILVIVEESLRGDFIDINMARGTTPFLISQRSSIANFGYASSGHNCSDQSNAILRWGVTPHAVSQARAQPTIWQYGRNAGYRTTLIDVQKRNRVLQNYLTEDEKSQMDNFVSHDSLESPDRKLSVYEKDLAAAEIVVSLLQSTEPQLIYFNKEGIHFPYEGKYPAETALFDNHMDGIYEAIGGNRDRLINSYKNAVHWSTDIFLSRLLPQLDLSRTIVIFTSDHGQNLLEQGLSTHCRVANPFYMEGLVPLFTMTEHKDWQSVLNAAATRNRDRAGHFNIFPTLLRFMGYEADAVTGRYGPSLLDEITARRAFAAGYIFDPDMSWQWIELPDDLLSTGPLVN